MNIFKAKFKGEEVKIVDGKPMHVATWESCESCEDRNARIVKKDEAMKSKPKARSIAKQVESDLSPSLQALSRALSK